MYTWKILSMESTPDTGVVVSANWSCTGEQDGFTSYVYGSCGFPPPSDPFVPYPDLTQDEVLNWCWTDGGVDKATTEAAVQNALDLQTNPPVVQNPLPWQSDAQPVAE